MKSFILGLIALGGLSGVAQAQPPMAQCAVRSDGSSICVNDRVLDYREATGTITAIYNDLTAVVAYDGGDMNTVDLQYLSREVGCIYGYCAGDDVIDDTTLDADGDGVEASISDLYENGMAEVTADGGNSFYYVEVNNLESGDSDDDIVITYNWASPRPYPDLNDYSYCSFGPPPFNNPYGWPDGYPYPHPVFGRVLFGIFPIAPVHVGFHGFNPYPYQHPVPYRGGGPINVNFGNRHPGNPGMFNGHGGDRGGPGRPGPVGPGRGDPGRPGPVGPGPGGPGRGDPGRPGPVGPGPGPIGRPDPVRPDPGPGPGPIGRPGPVGPGPGPIGRPDPVRPAPGPAPVIPGPYHPAPTGPAPAPGGGHPGGFGGGEPSRPAPAPGGGGGEPSRPAPAPAPSGGGHEGGGSPAPAPGGGGGGHPGPSGPGGGGHR